MKRKPKNVSRAGSLRKKTGDKAFFSDFLGRLFTLTIVLVIVAGSAYFLNTEAIYEQRLPKSGAAQMRSQLANIGKNKTDYRDFLRTIADKNIFTVAHAAQTLDASGVDMRKVRQTIDGLRLVGIMVDQPKKAMIESKDAQKTFYLTEGEEFLEGIIVEQIEKSSVVLDAYGQKFDLYL